MTLEQALLSELQKDVRLKGGQVAVDENNNPLKVFDAIAKSIINNAMKGDIAAVNFVMNLTRKPSADDDKQRAEDAAQRLAAQMQRMKESLEAEGLWMEQIIELEQLAQDYLILEDLNKQMQRADYQDALQEFRKDGTVTFKINPIHEWRDKYKKQYLADWAALRMDAQRRKAMRR